MTLTYAELDSITGDYFAADGGRANDIYFKTSFFVNWFMKKQKGLFERPGSGMKIRVPLKYDENEGGFFERSDPLTSDDRDIINAAFFNWKLAYGNATIYWFDELRNGGPEGEVDEVVEQLENAQLTVRKHIADSVYDANGDDSKYLTGLGSLVSETSATKYGDIAEDDLVATDGTKPWEGITTTTSEGISPAVIRTLRSAAKIHDGAGGKPDIGMMTETLFNTVYDILFPMQRFSENKEVTKAGFTNLTLDGMTLAADDFCTSGYLFLLNSNHVGFAIHKNANFIKKPWQPLPNNVQGRTMKILWAGNIICNNRKAHAAHSNLS
jgi:hypothetical protein